VFTGHATVYRVCVYLQGMQAFARYAKTLGHIHEYRRLQGMRQQSDSRSLTGYAIVRGQNHKHRQLHGMWVFTGYAAIYRVYE
jgi:hypothetical protein